MNILQIVTAFYPYKGYGGPSTVAQAQSMNLRNIGLNVKILTSDYGCETSNNTHEDIVFRLRSVKMSNIHAAIFTPGMFNYLLFNKKEIDIIHIHFAREFIPVFAAICAKRLRINYVLQTHGMLNTKSQLRNILDFCFTRNILKNAESVLVLNETERNRILEISAVSKISYLPNGIDLGHVPYSWDWSKSENVVLFLARLHPRKNVLLFIEAAKLVVFNNPDVKFRIVGPDEGDLQQAQQLVKKLDMSEKTQFVGALGHEEVLEEFRKARIYVLPSKDEPFSMTMIESMAVGTPIIVTKSNHIKDKLIENRCAEIVDENVKSLAETIEKLLEDRETAIENSKRGRMFVESELDLKTVTDSLLKIYEGVVK